MAETEIFFILLRNYRRDLIANARKKMKTADFVSAPVIESTSQQGLVTITMKGHWNTHTVYSVDDQMRALEKADAQKVVLDVSGITKLDTGGAWLIERLSHNLERRNIGVVLEGQKQGWESLLRSVGQAAVHEDDDQNPVQHSRIFTFFDSLGRRTVGGFHDFIMAMHILGSTIRGPQLRKGRGSGLSLPAVVSQIDRMGVGAVPIIVLMSFIVGAIIAQQGAFQLRYFGAELWVVDLVGILVFRELGVLMTAIMIAGRSGSAITAEIGSMKMREETDALTVMGLNPIAVLVFPRLVALAIVLPLLTVVADIAALVGAAVVAYVYSNISVEIFIARLNDAVWLSTYFAGIIKAPFMALIIGIIASVEGMKVKGSAESLGKCVTSSVVKSIFIVIVVDGFFAIFYAAINF